MIIVGRAIGPMRLAARIPWSHRTRCTKAWQTLIRLVLLAYRRLFEDMLSAELLQRFRECTNGGFVLGSAKFERQIAAMLGRRTWKGAPERPLKEIDADEQGELAL
ncbi:MAG: hypothetical protein N838_13110 [Thiohalocapsa sp. PB-PSB1]|nr:MAG: hypothetical protein N838_13110 [Thiohalocapsa sp. PB-PSB1]